MGMAKRELEQLEEYRGIAFRALVDIGAIKTCVIHDDFYYTTNQFDESEIYARVTAKLKKEYGETQDYKMFQSQVCEILTYAGKSAEDCPYCEKLDKE